MLRKFVVVLALVLFSSVSANSHEITNGTVTVPRSNAGFVAFVMDFSGSNFSVGAAGSNLFGIAFAPCTPFGFVRCTPGFVFNLSSFSGQWDFSSVSGTMTIDGTQFLLVNQLNTTLPFLTPSGRLSFGGGSVMIPLSDDASTITLKAPFTMSGSLSGRANMFLGIGLQLTGSGTASMVLNSSFIGGQKVYFHQSLTYRFGIPVDVDIKPGDEANHINLRSQGNVSVAILSTEAFDATAIDPLTVTVAGASVRIKPNGTLASSLEDINGDGLLDLVVHVNTASLQLTNVDNEVLVEGETLGGQFFFGTDTIEVNQ